METLYLFCKSIFLLVGAGAVVAAVVGMFKAFKDDK